MVEFAEVRHPVAKKKHKCEICGKVIEVGEKYHRYSGKYEGEFYDCKYCTDCDDRIKAYLDGIDECEFDEDGVNYFLQEEFCHKCNHGCWTEDCLDDCEESVWHCPIITEKIKAEQSNKNSVDYKLQTTEKKGN